MNKDLAYLAGIIDGEGHFYMPMTTNGRGERSPQARVLFVQSTQNNGLELCRWAKARYGGSISLSKHGMYRWCLSGKKAVLLAKRLQPMLIVKREQVRRIL